MRILDRSIHIDCDDPGLRALLLDNYGACLAPRQRQPNLSYSVMRSHTGGGLSLMRAGRAAVEARDASGFLFLFEKDLTVALQRRRTDLLFLHSATLSWHDRAVLLVGDSGVGKSTTAWALLHDGFAYLSDELAPLDLGAMKVLPYPHALCLKGVPDEYPLPQEALDLGATIHIPTRALPGGAIDAPKPLAAIFLLAASCGAGESPLRVLGVAEAGARLYTHVLNALAHPNRGLDAVLRVAECVPCFALARSELSGMGMLVRKGLEGCYPGRHVGPAMRSGERLRR